MSPARTNARRRNSAATLGIGLAPLAASITSTAGSGSPVTLDLPVQGRVRREIELTE
jgi:hypothetical protein